MNSVKRLSALFLLGLLFCSSAFAQTVTRGPYLQMQTQDSIIVRWRTSSFTDSVVRFGTDAGSLSSSVSEGGSTTEHTVTLSGLVPAQRYFYSVGNSLGPLAGDSSYHFETAPVPGVAADTRVWVIGDSGTADANAINVYNAFRTWSAADPADFWLMLGDNAYNSGTDAEYQAAVFNTYPEFLRQLPLWPTLGNHDAGSANSTTQSGPYYDIFELPGNGEAGGWASGTEAYYSFDYANIHFICLNSQDVSRAVGDTMMQWLEADLMDNAFAADGKPWVIAFWHHPPYTKGSHNSDTEARLIDMRQIALPILETWGVDLVLTGHSHSYERSYLLDGHYGVSTTLDEFDNVLDPGDGSDGPGGDGAYEKPDLVAAENAGAVYAVAGSSGKISGGSLDHPAMFVSLNSLGSMVLDVSGNRMDVTFLNDGGDVLDEFTLLKTPDSSPPLITGASAPDASHVLVDFNEPLNSTQAIIASNYSIAGLAISQAELLAGDRTVQLTTSAMSNGGSYTLVVNNLKDISGNTLLPDSSVNFEFHELMTVAFQDGIAPSPAYSGTRDGYIRQASPTTVHGLETTLQVDGDEPAGTQNDMNILLEWDISAIPADAIVEAAHLELEVTNPSNGAYYCYGLLRAWQEAQATWNQAASGSNWNVAGAAGATDRDSQQLCTVTAGSTGPLTVNFTAAGLSLVQSWVNSPSGNFGLIISNPGTTDGADFHARESSTAMARPRLEVTYRAPVVPTNNDPVAGYLDSCNYLACTFTDTSTDSDGTIASWSWNFGDGSTSTAQNPSHSFASSGNYTVRLTVTDNEGATDTFSSEVSVVSAPIAPTAEFTQMCTYLGCTFTDTSSDADGSVTAWAWTFGDGTTSSAQSPSHSYTSAASYTVGLTVTDNDSLTGSTSKSITVSAPPAYVDQLAQADLPSAGSVSGSYLDTHAIGGGVQSITERESGGKKNTRHSYLSHTWQFSVVPGSLVTLYANAWSSGSSDGDSFRFALSTDNNTFTELFTITSINPGNMESSVITESGTLYLRVTDTDQTPGNNSLDTVYVDQLYIRSNNGTPPSLPATPTNLAVGSPTGSSLSLTWQHPSNDETSFDLERAPAGSGAWALVASPAGNTTSYTNGGLEPDTSYDYRIRARNSAGSSAWSNTASGTTGAAPDLSLNASGYKVRGVHFIDLSWTGANGAEVNVILDGAPTPIRTTFDSTWTHEPGNKGGRTYVYQVCLVAAPGSCSNEATVVF